MGNKKIAVAVGVALAIAAYGGTTWYAGQKAHASYAQAVAELRALLGAQTVVSEEYRKGFFSSQAKLVLQWSAPTEEGVQPVAGAVPKPVRLVVDTTVRHGPLAGGQLAAAWAESHFALEGMDDNSRQALAKATAPTLTTVHRFTGSHDMRLLLPAGEIGDGEVTLRWQEMALDTSVSGNRVQGTWRWPELALLGLPSRDDEDAQEAEEDDGDEVAAEPVARTSLTFQGIDSSFDSTAIDGLWGLGPGKASLRLARMGITRTPIEGDAQTLLDLKDLAGSSVVEADAATLGVTTEFKGVGRIGPLDFESLGYVQKLQRLDIEALRNIQRALVDGYRNAGLAKAREGLEGQGADVFAQNAPRLVAALPAYSMKLQATFQGQTGELDYGAEVRNAPPAEQIAATGWMPALLQGTLLHANARLPKAWLAPLLQATGKPEVTADDVEGMVGMAQASGYARLEGEHLTSALKIEGGQMTLNGKPMALPMAALQ